MLPKDSICDSFNFVQLTESLVGTEVKVLRAFAISRIKVRQSLGFLSQTEATTSYRSISPELLELLTGTSTQLALNKGQEQQALTPSSLGEPRSNHDQWMYYEKKKLVLRD